MKKKSILFLLIIIILLFASKNVSNTVDSSNFKTENERINELKKYFKIRTEIIDSEFLIYDNNLDLINNPRAVTIPGPTDRIYKIAILLDKKFINLWVNDIEKYNNKLDYSWGLELIKNNKRFKIKSEPIFYNYESGSDRKTIILFKQEGILFISIEQH